MRCSASSVRAINVAGLAMLQPVRSLTFLTAIFDGAFQALEIEFALHVLKLFARRVAAFLFFFYFGFFCCTNQNIPIL